jgi:hypothetical protein
MAEDWADCGGAVERSFAWLFRLCACAFAFGRWEYVSRENAKGELPHRIGAGSEFAIRLIFAQDSGKRGRHQAEEGDRYTGRENSYTTPSRGMS